MNDAIDGIFIIDKPKGMTSFHVVRIVRRETGVRKVGHAGTLDPMATGVLPVCTGRATKLSGLIMGGVKVYEGVIRLGTITDSYDADGRVVEERPVPAGLGMSEVIGAAGGLQGRILQSPPPFSAVKQNGRPLYVLARRGIFIEKEPRPVDVHAFEILSFNPPDVGFRIRCGKGTYIRSLAFELGKRLGCGAHLAELRRLMTGSCTIESALSLEEFRQHARDGRLSDFLFEPCGLVETEAGSLQPTETNTIIPRAKEESRL